MKRLLAATLFIVLAAITETPDDHYLWGSGGSGQENAYLSAWENTAADEDPVIGEYMFQDEQAATMEPAVAEPSPAPDAAVPI